MAVFPSWLVMVKEIEGVVIIAVKIIVTNIEFFFFPQTTNKY